MILQSMLLPLSENAEIIDKFNGLADLDNRVLRAAGKAEELNEDALL